MENGELGLWSCVFESFCRFRFQIRFRINANLSSIFLSVLLGTERGVQGLESATPEINPQNPNPGCAFWRLGDKGEFPPGQAMTSTEF